jgi:hypothetical protein
MEAGILFSIFRNSVLLKLVKILNLNLTRIGLLMSKKNALESILPGRHNQ